jgi:hypothetical protein
MNWYKRIDTYQLQEVGFTESQSKALLLWLQSMKEELGHPLDEPRLLHMLTAANLPKQS